MAEPQNGTTGKGKEASTLHSRVTERTAPPTKVGNKNWDELNPRLVCPWDVASDPPTPQATTSAEPAITPRNQRSASQPSIPKDVVDSIRPTKTAAELKTGKAPIDTCLTETPENGDEGKHDGEHSRTENKWSRLSLKNTFFKNKHAHEEHMEHTAEGAEGSEPAAGEHRKGSWGTILRLSTHKTKEAHRNSLAVEEGSSRSVSDTAVMGKALEPPSVEFEGPDGGEVSEGGMGGRKGSSSHSNMLHVGENASTASIGPSTQGDNEVTPWEAAEELPRSKLVTVEVVMVGANPRLAEGPHAEDGDSVCPWEAFEPARQDQNASGEHAISAARS